jgi:hypothetical protein
LLVESTDAEVQEDGEDKDHARVAEREEVAHAQRALTVVDQFARRVVDGGDVVGVERMAHTECVGQHSRAHAERLGAVDVEVTTQGCAQHAPAEDIEPDDGERHPPEARPLLRCEAVADTGQPRGAHLDGNTEI